MRRLDGGLESPDVVVTLGSSTVDRSGGSWPMELKEEAGTPTPSSAALTEAEPPSARGPGGAGPSPPASRQVRCGLECRSSAWACARWAGRRQRPAGGWTHSQPVLGTGQWKN